MLESLQTEIRTFDARLPEFLRDHAGEVVLIQGTTVYGFFPDEDTAISEGYRQLGAPPFLAQKVEVQEPVFFAARPIRRTTVR